MKFFEQLGQRVESAWLQQSRDERILPAIAYAALRETPPSQHANFEDIIDKMFETSQPRQPAVDDFAQPQIYLYCGEKIAVEALFWIDGTTAVHEHAFSGAFHVLSGSSVHSSYAFQEHKRFNTDLRIGSLERVASEILHAGDTRQILSGNGFIHQLFHLDTPSVSIVIRNRADGDRYPQLSYRDPGIAINHFRTDRLFTRRRCLLELMIKAGMEQAVDYARRMLQQGDPFNNFNLVEWLHLDTQGNKIRQRVLVNMDQELITLFSEAAAEEDRFRSYLRFRSTVLEREPRLLLALLLLKFAAEQIVEFLSEEFPDEDADDNIASWIESILRYDAIPNQVVKELNSLQLATAIAC